MNGEKPNNIIPGVCYDEGIGDNIRVSVVATGVEKIVENIIEKQDESWEITNRKANNVIKNDFSNVNNNYAITNGNQIPHCFLNHIKNNNNLTKFNIKNKVMIQMIARRNKGKSIKIIYYKPLS